MSDFRPYFLYLLRGVAAGTIPVTCVRPAYVAPHFQIRDVLFCVFDDAGELDYFAWAACDQQVVTMDALTEVENAIPAVELDRIESALWAARAAHPDREGDHEGYLNWIMSSAPRTMPPVDRLAELPPLVRGVRSEFMDHFGYTGQPPVPTRVPWKDEEPTT